MPEEKKYVINSNDLVSEEIEDIIGQPPGWLVRFGTTVFFGLILLFFVGSAFFIYPNKVLAPVVITTQNPPLAMKARVDGKIVALPVRDTQKVKKGDLLAVMESAANYHEILELKKLLGEMPDTLVPGMDGISFPDFVHLGLVQPFYADFLRACKEYQHFIELDYHRKKLLELENELKNYRVYYNRLYRQRNLAEEELRLADKKFRRDSLLYSKEVLSESDYELSVEEWIKKKQAFEQARIRLSEAVIQMSGLEKEILTTQADYQNQKNEKKLSVQNALKRLYGSIDEWEKKYLLIVPVSGKVSFTRVRALHQYVERGKTVMTIVPDTAGKWIGRMKIPMTRSGQIKSGLPVNIRLKNYPYLEYGMIRGVVSSVSQVPEENSYFVDIDFPDGLVTLYGKKLSFKQQMEGTGEILTEKRSLLQRIFNPLRYMRDKYMKENNKR
ncbi:MAG TPA: HlyD family efflux transporter periplasmic adaptor subunit [Bacteroidetes bacterium]|nr:HlyD family efflux transporter periplasmic adaptor subunit [Bacteroidota bacterium]